MRKKEKATSENWIVLIRCPYCKKFKSFGCKCDDKTIDDEEIEKLTGNLEKKDQSSWE